MKRIAPTLALALCSLVAIDADARKPKRAPERAPEVLAAPVFAPGSVEAAAQTDAPLKAMLDLLPPDQRAPYASKLLRIVVDNQEKDGSMWDHVMHDYPRFYGTAYGLMAVQSASAAIAR